MDSFRSIILIVASCILILFLFIIGYSFYHERFNRKYPPVLAECPDYWDIISQGNNTRCSNVRKLGNENCPTIMDFSYSHWNGKDGLCNKYKWAKKCDLTWDGITTSDDACNFDEQNKY